MAKVSLRVERAKNRLSALGITQVELAEACSVDVRTIQRWLAGGRLKIDDAERVASALRLGTAELCEGVPEPGSALARVRAMHKALVARDGAVAQLLRMIPRLYPHMMEHVTFDAHPPLGHVYGVRPPASLRGFLVIRLTPTGPSMAIDVMERLLPSLMIERARIGVRPGEVWLLERFEPRSAYAALAPDGWFDLWFWVGEQTREIIFVSREELTVEVIEGARSTEFDLATPGALHAVCVRPGVAQLREAGLPRGFDRVLHRDHARLDLPVPDDL
jgi:transcriptional regulator with XRE-family HTH domain